MASAAIIVVAASGLALLAFSAVGRGSAAAPAFLALRSPASAGPAASVADVLLDAMTVSVDGLPAASPRSGDAAGAGTLGVGGAVAAGLLPLAPSPAGPAAAPIGAEGPGAGASAVPERDGARRRGMRAGRVRPGDGGASEPSGAMSGELVRRTIGRKRGALEACYHAARTVNPALVGDVTFLLTVKEEGAVVVDVESGSPQLAAAGVTECIRGKLESLSFAAAPPQGGDVHVRLPMSFLETRE